MQSIKRPSKNKKIILLIGIALVVVVALVAYFLFVNPLSSPTTTTLPDRAVNDVDYGPPTEAEKQAASQQKDDLIQQNETSPNPPNQTSDIVATIIRADQAEAGASLNIRAEIIGTHTGTCEIALSRNGGRITKSFPVVFEATSSRCQGADIAMSEFDMSGEWELSLFVKSGDKQSKTVQQTVQVEK